MQITKITPQAKNQHKVNIFIDDKFTLSLSIGQVNELGIKLNQQLDDESLAELKSASLFIKYYQKALDYLAKRSRSQKEIHSYIINKSSKNQVIKKRSGEVIKLKAELSSEEAEVLANKIVDHLLAKKFLDDYQFALYWGSLKLSKNLSNRMLRQELIKKGIAPDITDQAIAKLNEQKSEDQSLLELITKLKGKTRYQDELKLKRYLTTKGFTYAQITEALEQHVDNLEP